MSAFEHMLKYRLALYHIGKFVCIRQFLVFFVFFSGRSLTVSVISEVHFTILLCSVFVLSSINLDLHFLQ